MIDNLQKMDGRIGIFFNHIDEMFFDGKWMGYRDGWILFIADDGMHVQVQENQVAAITTSKRRSK